VSFSRVKKCFKKKKQQQHTEVPYKLEPEDIPHNMMVHTKFISRSTNGQFKFEVNGVIIYADNIIDAQRKYLRGVRR